MSDRTFFVSNIFVYAFDPIKTHKAEQAMQLLAKAADDQSAVISYQVVHEFFNVAFRKFHPPMRSNGAHRVMQHVFGSCLIVPSSTVLVESAFDCTLDTNFIGMTVSSLRQPWRHDAMFSTQRICRMGNGSAIS